MICCIEHFSKAQAEFILSEIKRVLANNGTLKIDFPNIQEAINLYKHDPEYMMELIYCNGKNEYSFHKWGYTRESFRKFLGEGWRVIDFGDIVKHDYPMIGCTAIKGERW
jgi:predicted SAM-dependent methyltransferase